MNPAAEFKILFDGDCPLCSREVDFLKRRDGGKGRLELEDISASDFDPARYGKTHGELMARIHGVVPDGSLVEGVEVFRRAYSAVGLGWLLAPTAWPGVRVVAEWAYRLFARNRLRWTGRSCACEIESSAPPRLSASGGASSAGSR